MFDFRLKVFQVVAKRLNFTKAAEELFISQPAVSKHIKEIESSYKTQLFKRNGSKIALTHTGEILLRNVELLMEIYHKIELELAETSQNLHGVLRIGASTTVANYYLPKYLYSFRKRFPDVEVVVIVNNTEIIESMLQDNKVDVGIVEGQSKRSNLKYTCVAKDKLVLCASMQSPVSCKSSLTKEELLEIPLALRERGSGSLEVILSALKILDIAFSDLTIDLELASTEGIKSYLANSQSAAFLPLHSIFNELKNNELKVIDVEGLGIERCFFFVTQLGDMHCLSEAFFRQLHVID